MSFLAWVLAPWLADRLHGPNQLPKALLLCLTAGLIWQFVLVVALVAREQRSLCWSRVRQALWLTAPRSPGTGRRGGHVWLVLVPLIVAFAAEAMLPTLTYADPRRQSRLRGVPRLACRPRVPLGRVGLVRAQCRVGRLQHGAR